MFIINDPGTVHSTGTLQPGSVVDIRRIVPSGTGAVLIYSTANVEVSLTDPLGRTVGYGLSTTIPDGAYYDEFIRDDDPAVNAGEPGPLSHILFVPTPVDGTYTLRILGTAAGSGAVRINKYSRYRNLPQGLQTITTALVPGESQTTSLTYTSVVGDVNGDGVVACSDIAIIRSALGKRLGQQGFDARADVTLDGSIDVRDLAFVSQRLPVGTRCQ
jgi:hypothetical protein